MKISDHHFETKPVTQKHFIAKDLQLTIAVMIVVALFAGTFLQSASAALAVRLGLSAPVTAILLILGYVVIVASIAVYFSHRLLGPFMRLEYEMRCIRRGECGRRLTMREQDDVHVKNFVNEVNGFLDDIERKNGKAD